MSDEITLYQDKSSGRNIYITTNFEDDGSFRAEKYIIYNESDREDWIIVPPEEKDKLLMALIQDKFSNGENSYQALSDYLDQKGINHKGMGWSGN